MPNIFVSAVLIAIAVLAPEPLAAGPSTILGAGPSTTVGAGTSELAVRIDESGAFIVPVRINGRGPFPFLLDTGSSHSVVSRSLVEQLALRFVAKTSVLTSTGREWRPVVNLDETTIGDARSGGLLASVTPSAQLDAVAPGIEGIIGQDFLFGLNYTLDYRRKRLVWNDERPDADAACLPLVAQEGRYLVQAMSTGKEAPVLLVPDSGASDFVAYERNGRTKLSPAFAPTGANRFGEAGSAFAPTGANRFGEAGSAFAPSGANRFGEAGSAFAPTGANRFGEAGSAAGMTTVHSLSGRQGVRMMMLRELRLGALTMKEQPVAVVPRDPNDVVEGDGLLPLHLFASVSFNARERCLVLRR